VKSLLFVDDEPLVLDGIRNLLRKYRTQWTTAFATSGAAALELLAQEPRDAVISDMRMPGMNGAELLNQVRERYPRTARILLTGQASSADVLQALPVAQQILSKPCEPALLCTVLERLFRVQELLNNEKIQAMVGSVDRLPQFPRCYAELTAAMNRDDVGAKEIAEIVKRDSALSLKALSMANSAYFGLTRATSSIPVAVGQIGFQLLRSVALSTDLFARIGPAFANCRTLRDLPERSLLKAQLARKFVSDRQQAEEAFTAALLLDVGHIVLAQCQGEVYLPFLLEAESGERPIAECEQERFGFTHAEVGAYLLGAWNLPARMVELVGCHHLPALLDLAIDPVVAAVHVADVLVDAMQAGETDPLAAIALTIRDRPDVAAQLSAWVALANQAA